MIKEYSSKQVWVERGFPAYPPIYIKIIKRDSLAFTNFFCTKNNYLFFCIYSFIPAHALKKGTKKLHQGLDISVRSTDNNKLRLQWDWTPNIMQSGFKVWYSVLILGTKFGPNVNSHKR